MCVCVYVNFVLFCISVFLLLFYFILFFIILLPHKKDHDRSEWKDPTMTQKMYWYVMGKWVIILLSFMAVNEAKGIYTLVYAWYDTMRGFYPNLINYTQGSSYRHQITKL